MTASPVLLPSNKTLCPSFDRLRTNGRGVQIIRAFPYMLSLSKHEKESFISLLNNDFLIRHISFGLFSREVQHTVGDVVRHERLAVVLPNVPVGLDSRFAP